jgi:aryl-alcohol dehydrogenase-like predicted oxidoreductase
MPPTGPTPWPASNTSYPCGLGVVDVVQPWCVARQVTLLPYSPLGRGFLTGGIGPDRTFTPDDARAGNPRFVPEAIRANQAIVEAVRAVGARLGASVAQVSLAWVLAQGDNVIPIPGPDRIDQLEEDVGAAAVVVDGEALAALDALPPPVP